MERLAQKSVHLAALHASWWTVLLLMKIIQDSSTHKVIATSSAPMIIMGRHVTLHAQQIARSLQVKQVVQRTLDFASSARAASGMVTSAKFLAVTAALEAHATKTRAHAITAAKKDGGEMLVRTHAPLALWVAVTARMASHRVAALVLSQA
jgi:hypothetical protein